MKVNLEPGEFTSVASFAHMRLKLKHACISPNSKQSPLNKIPPCEVSFNVSQAVPCLLRISQP